MTEHKPINIPRMRTVKEAAAEIKQLDAHSALTELRIRELALSGVLPRVQAGKKLLINLDTLFEYLQDPTAEKFQRAQTTANNAVQGIRKIF